MSPAPRVTSEPGKNESQDLERQPVERDTPAASPQEPLYDPVKGVRVDGQDLPWNALEDATKAYGAANGPRMRNAVRTIREVVWGWLQERSPNALHLAQQDPVEYEHNVAKTIAVVAGRLARESPALTWGPEGIARNFARALAEIGEGTHDVEEIVRRTLRKGETDGGTLG